MDGYELLEHTADIRLRAFGRSREEVFVNGALGMAEYCFGKAVLCQTADGTDEVTISSFSWETLLVDWLSELLYRTITRHRAYIKFDLKSFTPYQLSAMVGSCPAVAAQEIKAITHYELSITNDGLIWQATVTFDI